MATKTLQCFYRNDSDGIQVVRLFNSVRGLEKTLGPGDSISFQAQHGNALEVHDFLCPTSTLSERIDCSMLGTKCCRLSEPSNRWDILDKQSA